MATKTNTTVKGKGGAEYKYYRITKTIGHKYINGKKTPIKKSFYGTSKKNAEKKYEIWKENQFSKKNINVTDSRSFGELLDYYCENILMINSKYEITTRDQYKQAYIHYIKNINIVDIPLSDLRSEHIQLAYNNLNTSNSMMMKINCFMRGFFEWAASNKICENLLNGVIMPDKNNGKYETAEEIVCWTDDEITAIMNNEPNHKYKPLLVFALYSGMRISELFGLQWNDIYDDVIHVRRQYCRGYWKNPKQNEKRDIPMHKKIKEYVDRMDHNSELVFANEHGEPLVYSTVTNNLSRFYERNGIPHKKFHAYRATFCTNLCKKGVPIQIAAKLAGHKSIEVTAQYYTVVGLDEKISAISRL